MRLFTKVPEQVRALRVEERRLAWALSTDGLPLVATESALHVGTDRLAWTAVEKVVWQPPALTLVEVSDIEGSGPRHTWELAEDHRLAEIVRARVTSSIGWSDRRALVPSGAVRLVGRRVPGQDALLWQTVFEPGTDPNDPSARAQAQQWVEALRASIG